MGFTYKELSTFGSIRKIFKCGPLSMFKKLSNDPEIELDPPKLASRVKSFFFYYSINRHKTTVLPPSYHMSAYSPDDNRFDLRPILYNSKWDLQFKSIENEVSELLNET